MDFILDRFLKFLKSFGQPRIRIWPKLENCQTEGVYLYLDNPPMVQLYVIDDRYLIFGHYMSRIIHYIYMIYDTVYCNTSCHKCLTISTHSDNGNRNRAMHLRGDGLFIPQVLPEQVMRKLVPGCWLSHVCKVEPEESLAKSTVRPAEHLAFWTIYRLRIH